MELIEVIDSAVKIGLGAFISGASTYLLSRRTHVNELRKISYVRRLEALESVSDKAEDYFVSWRRYASKLGGIYSGQNPPAPDFSDNQWKQIRMRDKSLLEARESFSHSIARLRLLSADEAADRLTEFSKAIGEFRDNMILNRETPTNEEFLAVRKKANQCIKKFHEEMSAVYNRESGSK